MAKDTSPGTEISIIIVTWNVIDCLEKCLSSIIESLDGEETNEIIVVDNGSVDETIEIVKKKFPRVKLIENSQNYGFAKANNQGFNESRGEIVFFLNPDTLIRGKAIQKLLLFVRNTSGVGIVGPQVIWPDGKSQFSYVNWAHKRFNFLQFSDQLLRNFTENLLKSKKFRVKKPIKVAGVRGMAMMVKRSVIKEVGGFDESFFLNAEAGDLCFRVRARGYQNYFFPGAEIIHFGGRSKRRQSFLFNFLQSWKSNLTVVKKTMRKR